MRTICFGEVMLRLAPPGYTRFVQANAFCATYGGGEANVAVSLANFGADAAFVTRLPTNELGQAAVNTLRGYGVDVSHILRGGERIGVYYLEKGASQRPSKVIYDRAGSAFATASADAFDWAHIFRGADWFHVTGITPALGANLASATIAAAKTAKEMGLCVSCDLNYRKNLWSRTAARTVMETLAPFVDLCIANEEDAGDVFDIHAPATDIVGGVLSRDGYVAVAHRLAEVYGFSRVAITLRESLSASDNNWAAMLYDGTDAYFSRKYPVHIVDRVGGGDSFGAGLIYALQSGMGAQSALEFAVAASCLKHTIEGDVNCVTADEVKRLANGDASGRVQR